MYWLGNYEQHMQFLTLKTFKHLEKNLQIFE